MWPCSFGTGESTLQMDRYDSIPFLVCHITEAGIVWAKWFAMVAQMEYSNTSCPLKHTRCSASLIHRSDVLIYLRMPALLIKICTPPKTSNAVWMTAAPSVTEALFTAAFPPAKHLVVNLCRHYLGDVLYTLSDLINYFLSRFLVEIIDHDIRASRRI